MKYDIVLKYRSSLDRMVKKIAEKFLTNWKLSDDKPVVVEKYDKVRFTHISPSIVALMSLNRRHHVGGQLDMI